LLALFSALPGRRKNSLPWTSDPLPILVSLSFSPPAYRRGLSYPVFHFLTFREKHGVTFSPLFFPHSHKRRAFFFPLFFFLFPPDAEGLFPPVHPFSAHFDSDRGKSCGFPSPTKLAATAYVRLFLSSPSSSHRNRRVSLFLLLFFSFFLFRPSEKGEKPFFFPSFFLL